MRARRWRRRAQSWSTKVWWARQAACLQRHGVVGASASACAAARQRRPRSQRWRWTPPTWTRPCACAWRAAWGGLGRGWLSDQPHLKRRRQRGAGAVEHFAPAIEAGADAVLAASVFHNRELTIGDVKRALDDSGIEIRR